jgi:para-aminobenzoate synthetase/4-amino-4-deoxychorismate lyase
VESAKIKVFRRNGATQGCDVDTTVILDDASPRTGRIRRFGRPQAVIQATQPAEVPGAFAALEAALADGRHVAGWFSYELGYALEPRLGRLQWPMRNGPLLWFGVFDAPEIVERGALHATRAYAGPLHHEWDEDAYRARFDRVHEYIAAGDIYQANLSFRSRFAFAGDPLALYLRLRDQALAPHGAYIDMGSAQILSLSPELFFAIDAQGHIVARPMKGTAPRGADELSDARAKAALASSAKDRAENLMIVDLLRNDLGRLALIGSVAVRDLFAVETYPTLHTMVSTVTAQLRPALRVEAIVRALFPCGSVTGAPKIRAMEVIREMEESPRGVYCGAIGYFAPDGSANFNVGIRTIALEGNKGVLGIGGAVVQDSTADAEYAECLLKARYFERVREPIGLIETLRWDGDFVGLDRHLARIERSAAFLSLPFNDASARDALARAVAGATEPQRVRLTLDEQGTFAGMSVALGPTPAQWTYTLSAQRVRSADPLLRHKTTWRQLYDQPHPGADEVIFCNERGELTEGGRTSLFIRRGGHLLTPALSCGLLDGVLRRAMLDEGACVEAVLTPADLETADEVLVGNSLRGLIRAVPALSARASA